MTGKKYKEAQKEQAQNKQDGRKKSRYTNNYNKWKQKKGREQRFLPRQKPCHSSPGLSFSSVLSPKSMSLDTAACFAGACGRPMKARLWALIPETCLIPYSDSHQQKGQKNISVPCSALSLLEPMISQGSATWASLLTRRQMNWVIQARWYASWMSGHLSRIQRAEGTQIQSWTLYFV